MYAILPTILSESVLLRNISAAVEMVEVQGCRLSLCALQQDNALQIPAKTKYKILCGAAGR